MSKTAKGLLAALIICVLAVVGGLFACKPLVEQAVRDVLRTANPDAAICSVETVDINPLSFTLKLGNIHLSDQRTYDTTLKEISLTLSPPLRPGLRALPAGQHPARHRGRAPVLQRHGA